MSVDEGQALGAWLGVVGRGVVRGVVMGGDDDEDGIGDWNVVQNNGIFNSSFPFPFIRPMRA